MAEELLVHRLERWAELRPEVVAVRYVSEPRALTHRDAVDSISYAELYRRSCRIAAGLRTSLAVGDRALLTFSPGLDYVCAFVACQMARIVAVPLYPPSSQANMQRFVDVARNCSAGAVLTTATWAQRCADALSDAEVAAPVFPIEILAEHDEELPSLELSGELAFLQYTSGSTGTPRGVMVTQQNLAANLVALSERFGIGPEDHQASWLPPYHDMGLIAGILQPLYDGITTTLMSPFEFLRDSLGWLDVISHFQATYTGAPNFGYAQCTRHACDERLIGMDLRRLRLAFCGAEPVSAGVLDGFGARFASTGFDAGAFLPAYGLAEATLIVSGTQGDGVRSVLIPATTDAKFYGQQMAVQSTTVALGRPIRDTEVCIVNPDSGVRLNDGLLGEVWVRGPGIAAGYWHSPEETQVVFRAIARPDDGRGPFMRTGDLGFLTDERLCIAGRIKDLLIVNGRNVYPQDIETAAWSADERLRPGGQRLLPQAASPIHGSCWSRNIAIR
ncbi:fatty acyl-AMP ligase [Nocardia camponoti]|nr:fatty acyl-AMP ligase [Nocardia camponoti]